MCVPYSFVITKEGEIFSGLNLDHHTQICDKHGLRYDDVLKPEYQIWNRETKDLDLPESERRLLMANLMSNVSPKSLFGTFYTKEGFLKERYASLASNHLDKTFKTWKDGLEYFGNNWGIVERYATKLVKHPSLVINTAGSKRQWLIKQVTQDIAPFVKVETLEKPYDIRHDRQSKRYILTFDCPSILEKPRVEFMVDISEILYTQDYQPSICLGGLEATTVPFDRETLKRRMDSGEVIAYKMSSAMRMLQNDVVRHLNSGELRFIEEDKVDFKEFKRVFEQEENRVECWLN